MSGRFFRNIHRVILVLQYFLVEALDDLDDVWLDKVSQVIRKLAVKSVLRPVGGDGIGYPLLSCADIEELLSHFLPRRDTTEEEVLRQLESRHRYRQAAIESHTRRSRKL